MTCGSLWCDVTVINVSPGASGDDTVQVQAAIDQAEGGGQVVFAPGTFIIDGGRSQVVPGARFWFGVAMRSGVRLTGSGAHTILLLKSGSTGVPGAEKDPQMFWAGPNGLLEDVMFEHLTFDGNAQGNPLLGTVAPGLPPCSSAPWGGITGGDAGDNDNCCAIHAGGVTGTDGPEVVNLTVRHCTFRNFPGANVVLVHDRRSSAPTFSREVEVSYNHFFNNRFSPDPTRDVNRDHSTVNIFADDVHVDHNSFDNPKSASVAQQQIMAACELHGSRNSFNSNRLVRYGTGVIFSQNLDHVSTIQEARSNLMVEHGYRGFDVSIVGQFKSVGRIDVVNNEVTFGQIPAVANQVLSPAYGAWLPFAKWCVSFNVPAPATLDVLNVDGNRFDGDVRGQKPSGCHVVGPVAGINGVFGGQDYTGQIAALNITNNAFRRLTFGVWLENLIGTVARSVLIEDNRFTDFSEPVLNEPIYASARGVYVKTTVQTSGASSPIVTLRVTHNWFENVWNDATYEYGFSVEGQLDTVVSHIGNQYSKMKVADVWIDGVISTD